MTARPSGLYSLCITMFVHLARDNGHVRRLISQEIGFTHMRISEGVDLLLQLSGLLARLLICLKSAPQKADK